MRLAALISVRSHIGNDTEPSPSELDVALVADEYEHGSLDDQQCGYTQCSQVLDWSQRFHSLWVSVCRIVSHKGLRHRDNRGGGASRDGAEEVQLELRAACTAAE